MKTMKTIFEQRSELSVSKKLVVHTLSRGYNIPSFKLGNKKAAQENSFCVTNKNVLNRICVYHERAYAAMSQANSGL